VAELLVHEMELPADAWREWAGSDDMKLPLAARLRRLGARDGDTMIDRALAEPGWRAIAALDAAARTVQALVGAGALARGASASEIVRALASDPSSIPDEYWSAR